MISKEYAKHLGVCAAAICDPLMASNPIAWFDLEASGITREAMRDLVEKGHWEGPPPCFDKAPARDSEIWKHLEAAKAKSMNDAVQSED